MTACWGITDGRAGMAAQVHALAAALGVEPVMKTCMLQRPWRWLPNQAYAPLQPVLLEALLTHFLSAKSDALAPPWPALVISCGRRAAAVALALRQSQRTGPRKTYFIHIQDPLVASGYFDQVVAMEHDRITGPNVLKTRFALHRIDACALAQAKTQFQEAFATYPAPRITVLLGGSTNKYTLTAQIMERVIALLRGVLERNCGALLVTPSRRTGAANAAMLDTLKSKRVYIYDMRGDNPYMALLALADFIIVTDDSVNMMTEACATGKPVYLLKLPGHENTKPARFAQALVADGSARWLDAETALAPWYYEMADEMEPLARTLKERMNLHFGASSFLD